MLLTWTRSFYFFFLPRSLYGFHSIRATGGEHSIILHMSGYIPLQSRRPNCRINTRHLPCRPNSSGMHIKVFHYTLPTLSCAWLLLVPPAYPRQICCRFLRQHSSQANLIKPKHGCHEDEVGSVLDTACWSARCILLGRTSKPFLVTGECECEGILCPTKMAHYYSSQQLLPYVRDILRGW